MSEIGNSGVATVTGVLKYNEKTRYEMLRHLYWGDANYLSFANDDIVHYVNLPDDTKRTGSSLTDGKDLYTYTHDKKSAYSQQIRKRNIGTEDVAYNIHPPKEMRKWEGDYLETFNPNLSDVEVIGNLQYSALRTVEYYKRNDRFLEKKYITPKLNEYYGSSEGLTAKIITNPFTAIENGRIPDIAEADVKIEHDYLSYLLGDKTENISSVAENGDAPKRYLYEAINNSDENGDVFSEFGRMYVPFIEVPVNYRNIGMPTVKTFYDESVEITNMKEKGDWQSIRLNESAYSTQTLTNSHKGGNSKRYITYDRENHFYEEGDRGTTLVDINKKSKLHANTSALFTNHKLSTMLGRFHTTINENGITDKQEITDTAKSATFGNSHGRNLLRLNASQSMKTGDYENPYCRVWTHNHEYNQMSRLIRPFTEVTGNSVKTLSSTEIRKGNPYEANYPNSYSGSKYLEEFTVLNNNGMVNIAPKDNEDIKKCMFSIENLAWKDIPKAEAKNYISKEQTGPHGGRIMWFPPYDLEFQESINVDWNSSKFLGRGESVYTYSNTERTGTLSFSLLIDHPSIIDNIPVGSAVARGNDDDLEGDILRFFAGCNTLLTRQPKNTGDNAKKKETPNGGEAEEVPNNEGQRIKFYVYFPNNYSGHGTVASTIDSDWYTYLLAGKDITVTPKSPATFIGYEMASSASQGITSDCSSTKSSDIRIDARIDSSKPKTQKEYTYGHRVDKDLNQRLWNNYEYGKQPKDTRNQTDVTKSTYHDTKSFGLNSQILDVNSDATCTFAEFCYACFDEIFETTSNEFAALKSHLQGGFVNNGRVEDLKNALRACFHSSAVTITYGGGATTQDVAHTPTLTKRRAASLRNLLEGVFSEKSDTTEITYKNENQVINTTLTDKSDTNTKEAKAQRYAYCEIVFDSPIVQALSVTDFEATHTITAETSQGIIIRESEPVLATKEQKENARRMRRQINRIRRNHPEIREELEKAESGNIDDEDTIVDTNAVSANGNDSSEWTKSRYETESEYFSRLNVTDPMLYGEVKKQFKYFMPAFHSISPEGFNARLTFLQQCTRQGRTIEYSGTNNQPQPVANNLAFGRMPVCVLRIGDFLNTKILIRNISITYSNGGSMQWDLNPEGAGVQPMYAKVSMGIVLLGGQSLAGPINRLQNAVSFNYYANTGVYDDRADIPNVPDATTSSESRTVTEYKHLWTPTGKS